MATILELSVSTVSKALNDSPEISVATKEKVHQVAKSLNYKPNVIASALRNRRSLILGVILPDLKDTFFLESLIGITEESSKNDYKIMVYQSCNDYKKEIAYTKLLSESNIIDGLIFSSIKQTETSKKVAHIKSVTEKGLPVVYIKNNIKFSSGEVQKNNACSQKDGFKTGQNCVKKLLRKIENEQLNLSA
ncbi:LacI family DNA-binding transcriptional regulator [Kordia sp.]|uniref:LacI family DNA-binding transcriptional regulator n=1 Tax=Kordia sp. TaxID=1965332 RepID=UPI0025C107F4|nr:LacI family DNA-binding transcriptional regulator [Kordia sp.]MCH2193651.1 LacI family transcriptional regulator [Kordia sp.]